MSLVKLDPIAGNDTSSPAAEKRFYSATTISKVLAFAAILAMAAWLRIWGLDQNGTGNPYYAAAVRSMLVSWSNFFFGSFDPTGLVTVDKPPVALWAQAMSAKILGYNGFSLLFPQAVMGTATVALLYFMVRRVFGIAPALMAALILAITPISVAVDRDNLPDTLLTLLLVLAAGALIRATETGRWRWLLACVTFVGIGFNVKMLAAFVVLPTYYLVYFLAAPLNRRARLGRLTVATVVLAIVSLSWCVVVEVTPTAARPYIGGSRNNSALELALGYNGLGRVFGGSGNMGPPGRAGRGPFGGGPPGSGPGGIRPGSASGEDPSNIASQPGGPGIQGPSRFRARGPGSFFGGPPGAGFPGGPPGFGGTPGMLRFTRPVLAEQITWLFPLAAFGILAFMLQYRWRQRWGAEQIAVCTWLGWLGTHWIVFSFAQGIFHDYYTVVLGPAVAVLAGVGATALWKTLDRSDWGSSLFPTTVLATGAWQTYLIAQYAGFRYGFVPLVLGGACLGTAFLVSRQILRHRWPRIAWGSVGGGVGLVSVLAAPAVWSVGTALAPGVSIMPTANVSVIAGSSAPRFTMPSFDMNTAAVTRLTEFLRANRRGEKYFVASPASMEVAPLIIHTGEPAVSLGGFMGADAIFTKDQFVNLVKDGGLRFVMTGSGPGSGLPPLGPGGGPFGPGSGATLGIGGPMAGGLPANGFGGPGGPAGPFGMGNSEIMTWVRANGKVVDPTLWRTDDDQQLLPVPFGPMGNASQLYDLRPDAGWIEVADDGSQSRQQSDNSK
jgi:4-amino-4-deoxy-L-arabinose transferase-like glycosyltransferase